MISEYVMKQQVLNQNGTGIKDILASRTGQYICKECTKMNLYIFR